MPPPVDASQTWQTVEGTEPVTLYARTDEATFATPPVMVPNAKRRAPDLLTLQETGALLASQALVWHIWLSQTGIAVKEGDVIQDGAGVRWTVKTLAAQSFGQRFRCACLKERP